MGQFDAHIRVHGFTVLVPIGAGIRTAVEKKGATGSRLWACSRRCMFTTSHVGYNGNEECMHMYVCMYVGTYHSFFSVRSADTKFCSYKFKVPVPDAI